MSAYLDRLCDHKCMPSNETLHPDARHWIDCDIWEFTGVRTPITKVPPQRRAPGSARIGWGDTMGQRVRTATPLRPTPPLYAGMALVTGVCVLGVVAIVVLLFGTLLGWWG